MLSLLDVPEGAAVTVDAEFAADTATAVRVIAGVGDVYRTDAEHLK